MPSTNEIGIKLNGKEINLPQAAELPIALSYELEDESDFRVKKAGTAMNLKLPATLANSKHMNTMFNPGAEDNTPTKEHENEQDIVIVGAGHELMKGKAFVLSATSQGGKPKEFTVNAYGNNADWSIPGKDLTLHDVVGDNTHLFTKANIEASWTHDGTVEAKEYVYAPVRYREAFGEPISNDLPDEIFRPVNARPMLFIYWLLWRGFKMLGYKINSQFMDTDYFRRMCLAWTWGNFFYITDKLLKEMQFLATGPLADTGHGDGSAQGINGAGPAYSWFCELEGGYTGSTVLNDVARFDSGDAKKNFFLDNVTTDIGYIGNALSYSYNPSTGVSAWEYLSAWSSLGLLTVGFEYRLSASLDCSMNSNCSCELQIMLNGTTIQTIPDLFKASAPTFGTDTDFGTRDFFFEVQNLNPGDVVSIQLNTHLFKSTLGFSFLKIICTGDNIALNPTNITIQDEVRSYWKLAYVKRQLGSVIEWKKFDKFKNYKWLDLLRGVTDAFNLQFNTDTVLRQVTIEPTHDYSLTAAIAPATNAGYNTGVIDWTKKQDISKESTLRLFQDYEREVSMAMQSDKGDGLSKLMEDRHQINLTAAKYVFPQRFRKGIKETLNRFFSSVMHYNHDKWKQISGISPQLICIVPENVANTSNPESESTFEPKLVWYAGQRSKDTVGGWNWDGDTTQDLPYAFAVNYKLDGQNDPILTYCDQRIEGVRGFGLFKRYFWQRFAIMRHGKILDASFLLNNTDVINFLHREFKSVNGQRYQLRLISQYKPLLNQSTACSLWKWYPVTNVDNDNTFPSEDAVLTGVPLPSSPDVLYIPSLCLTTDIPV